MKKRHLINTGLFGLALALVAPLPAQDKPAPTASLSAMSNPSKRAKWQEHLTLGPGDVLNFALYEQPELARQNVVVGPDGRVTYLQAENVMAAGLTIDELRGKVDGELGKFYKMPHTVITPVTYNSKKFFVLGSVVNKGVFPLNRPTSIIEAIGQAGGLQTGLFEQKQVEMADLTHSFMIRSGKKLEVDFEKLFRGDLSQNIPLEPDDYMFFSPASANEIYVLGAVITPGVVRYSPNVNLIGALAERGGFVEKAYQSRVLVVRGSLQKPETFIVDTKEILAGGTVNFKLQPKDIVYVSMRPWYKAEELLDSAVTAFIQASVVTYTGVRIGPFITSPIFK